MTNPDTLTRSLSRLTVRQLQERYAEVFGEPTRVKHKLHLVRRIVWREQALREGGLSERARRRAEELARDADIRLTAPRPPKAAAGEVVTEPFSADRTDGMPRPGTVLRRVYKGRTVMVRVLPKGFECDGQVFRSLTAVATHVTGSHWNGLLFFGLRKGETR